MKRIQTVNFTREVTMLFDLASDGDGTMPNNREAWRPFVERLIPHAKRHGMLDDLKLGLAYLLQRPEANIGRFSWSHASLEEWEMRTAAEDAFAILWPDDDWRTIPTDDVEFSE